MSSFRPLAAVAAVGAAVMCLGACSGSVSQSDLEARIAVTAVDGSTVNYRIEAVD